MQIDHRIDPSGRVLRTTLQGEVTTDLVRQHIEAVRDMEGQRYPELIDARAATPRFSARELPRLVQDARVMLAHMPMAPRAVVVNGDDPVAFGLARLFAALATPWISMRVFDNEPAATAYIDAIVAHTG